MNTCENCRANKVCDHNLYGFENCGNFIPQVASCNTVVDLLGSAGVEPHLKFVSIDAVVDAIEETPWYHISSDGKLVNGANSRTDEPLHKAADIEKAVQSVPVMDLAEVRVRIIQSFFDEVNLALAAELHKALEHSYYADSEYTKREIRKTLSSIMSTLGEIQKRYLDGEIKITDLAIEVERLKLENEKLVKENEAWKVMQEIHRASDKGWKELYDGDTDALLNCIHARDEEIAALEEMLGLYKEVCGELVVKDHLVIGLLRGKETAYIPENIAKVYKGIAVNTAKRGVAKSILTDKILVDHLERACGAGGQLALARIEELKEEHGVKNNERK